MKYWLDCEFDEHDGTIVLISIGMVDEDGREFYAESSEVDWGKVDPWILENVRPHLLGNAIPRSQIRDGIVGFIGEDTPEFWAYNGAFDWVSLCSLFGRMIDLPKGWPHRHRELKDEMERLGVKKSELPEQVGTAHNALADAQWNRRASRFLDGARQTFGEGPQARALYRSWASAREANAQRDPAERESIAKGFQHAADRAQAVRDGRLDPMSA